MTELEQAIVEEAEYQEWLNRPLRNPPAPVITKAENEYRAEPFRWMVGDYLREAYGIVVQSAA